MNGTKQVKNVYLRNGRKTYYFRYTDANGVRCQRNTNSTKKKEALIIANQIIGNEDSYLSPRLTLSNMIAQYENLETNPRRRMALTDGSAYSDSYGSLQTRYAKYLDDLLSKKMPSLLSRQINSIRRADLHKIKEIIVKEKGHCRTAQLMYEQLRRMFNQALSDGILEKNITDGERGISYKRNNRKAVAPEVLAEIIDHKDWFDDDKSWAFFTVLATTGLRLSEALGITPSRINNGVLTVDRQLQYMPGKKTTFIPPKCGITRVIPLSKITISALEVVLLKKRKNQPVFTIIRSNINPMFKTIRTLASEVFPQYKDSIISMTSHALRHSLNTNLLIHGSNPILVAEYLSWKHQELIDMQQNYTHFVAMNLKPIADAIDNMFIEEKNNQTIVSFK
ncbi:MAG: tyrosine-type recombinase/integrase [Sphaerochaetaceae bacterium]|nr:tyrosine-type recombinase/integrase [Sphaerochaetaceae bacterium]